MEAASRSAPELLSDLPVETPFDTAPAAAAGSHPTPDTAQTSLNFMDPELFAPTVAEAAAGPAVRANTGAPAEMELTLEDPLVDELLEPPVPTAPVVRPPQSAAASLELISDAAVAGPGRPATPRAESPPLAHAAQSGRVPIARTATLAAAAARPVVHKPAAAPAPRAAPAPAAASVKQVADARPATPAAAPATAAEAPSFASWTSARVAAAAAARPAASAAARPAAVPTVGATAATAAAGAATGAGTTSAPHAGTAAAPAVPQPIPMDRDFIARNQVVERYLSGRLPLRGAADFERFCHEHPEMLDEIGLTARVNAGVRLLEASGKPEPWQEAPRLFWDKPQVTLGLMIATVLLAAGLAVAVSTLLARARQVETLKRQVVERALDPAASTREIRLLPSRAGASNSPAITIGGSSAGAELAVLKIDESRSPYHTYRVTIDRIDQGRVGVISNLGKDSNGHLLIALNSSALGPGNYQFTIEGMDWRGQPTPDSWITVGVVR